MRTLIILAALCMSASGQQVFERANGIAEVGGDGIALRAGGNNDGSDILPLLAGDELKPTVVYHRGETIGVILEYADVPYLVATGPNMGPEVWSGTYAEQVSVMRWLHTDSKGRTKEFTTRSFLFDGETLDEYQARAYEHENNMFSAGFVVDEDWSLASDGSGGPVGQGFKVVGFSTQSTSSDFAKYEDHDRNPNTPDRVRRRKVTTWRRTGETIGGMMNRHEKLEDHMWKHGWVQ